jgi:prepilin-type N-terminal cleavage/methylation domain-containing protein
MKKLSGGLKQAGISLLEVLLALAIIAIIYVMSMQYFTTATYQQKLNMIRTLIGADMAAVQSYGINNPTYKNLSWYTLVTNGYINEDPKNIDCSGGSCMQKTPWGSDITLNSVSGTSGEMPYLSIPLPDPAYCNNLVDSYGAQIVQCDQSGVATVYLNANNPAS